MKKTLFSLALLAACSMAAATGNHNPTPTPTPGGTNVAGGAGGSGIALAGALAFGAGGAGGAGGQGGAGGFGGTGMGGLGGTGGDATGGANSLTVAGSTYREAASPAYAPPAHGPRKSCRLFVGLGGSTRDESLSGGIPIGNDQICVSGAQFEFMDRVNAIKPGTFTAEDYVRAACAVEGMAPAAACKPKSAEQQRAEAILEGRPQVTAAASAPVLP